MIRSVADTTTAKPATSAAGKPSGAAGGFAAEMAKATTTATATATAKTEKAAAKHAAPKGERTEAVPGHTYAEIVAGPRNGMFLNMSHNKRGGEAFLIVQRHGRTFHVYGSGHDREVVEVSAHHAAKAATPAGTTPTASGATS